MSFDWPQKGQNLDEADTGGRAEQQTIILWLRFSITANHTHTGFAGVRLLANGVSFGD